VHSIFQPVLIVSCTKGQIAYSLEDKDTFSLQSKMQACLLSTIIDSHPISSGFLLYNVVYFKSRYCPAHFVFTCGKWGSGISVKNADIVATVVAVSNKIFCP
jgi:hypothetical protein